ncbi:E3 ubiquitin-protein ligase TRIM39-like [Pelobates fuscus]|uniref:E3 ubiquitin-protein ligase TRIM39-like n=1 Tax=Pelobates fuscus TaxID=191477 RepID=UPI002FE43B06
MAVVQAINGLSASSLPVVRLLRRRLDVLLWILCRLFAEHSSPSMVDRHLAALAFLFKFNGWVDVTKHFLVRQAVRGFRKGKKARDKRRPVSFQVLQGLVERLPDICFSGHEVALFSTAFVWAFFGAFRIGELDDVGHKRKMLACEFESLRQRLSDNEQVLNDRLEKMEKTIVQKRDETISKLDGKLSTLQKLIADLEKNRVPTVSQSPESKQDSNGAVMRPIEGAQFLEQTDLHRMMASRDYMKMFTVSVTFYQKTANFNLSVSGNQKLVRYEEYPKNVMPHPDRFDSKPCVLGLTGYKIGKRYWEVDVGGGIYWSVGVA